MTKHITLIAPSSRVSDENVITSKKYFEDLGMKVSVPSDLMGDDLLCANTDEARLSHLKSTLQDDTVDVIWMLSGGYGLSRLMPGLLDMQKPEKEKLLFGFSDGTALHIFLNQFWNWPSIHGIVVWQAFRKMTSNRAIEASLRILKEGLTTYEPPLLIPCNKRAKEMNTLSGSVIGGNLCLLQTSLGTRWQVNTTGKILFLEDVDERGYRVDRMLTQLDQAGLFKDVKAILLGDFTGGKEADGTTLIPPVLERFANTMKVPVFSLPGCGHGRENYPLPFNINLTFMVSE